MFVNRIGEVSLKLSLGNKITVENVRYVLDLATNLLSVSKIAEKGTTLVFDKSGCRIFKSKTVKITGDLQGTASQVNGLYCLDVQSNNVQNWEEPKETVVLSASALE